MKAFMDELKRRRVVRVALVYLAAAFAALQAADLLVPALHLPAWLVTAVAVAVITGMPVALGLAWAFDVTPDGVKRTDGAAAAPPAPAGSWINRRTAAAVVVLLVLGGGLAAGLFLRPGDLPEDRTAERRRLAVLPFRNANPGDADNATLALGVHDDLLSRLSKVPELRVVSRTSVAEYASTEKNLRQIALELGVGTILEGGVQRAGDKVRINVQLIDALTDEHLWAETYDRPWSLDNLFAIQSEIAEHVASALRARLTADVRASLAARPTQDEEAYAYYVRARQLAETGWSIDRAAIELVRSATRRDSTFAAAWALEGRFHAALYFDRMDPTPERLQMAKAAIDRALALDPELPDARVSLGYYYYWGFLDYERAWAEFSRAEKADPSAWGLLHGMGAVRRRQGRMEEALSYMLRHLETSPRSTTAIGEALLTLALLRRYDEALVYADRWEAVTPESPDPHFTRAWLNLLATGDLEPSRVAFSAMVALTGEEPAGLRASIAWVQRDYRTVLKELDASRDSMADNSQFAFRPVALQRALAWDYLGVRDSASRQFTAAAALLERASVARPEDDRVWSALGLAYAGLGRHADAERAARHATALVPLAKEAWRGMQRMGDLAEVLVRTGRHDEAITLLEQLMRLPAGLTVSRATLRLDQAWDPLRSDSRFQALVAGTAR
jgi:TolB-like protein/Flp pilus assembly protein TadD